MKGEILAAAFAWAKFASGLLCGTVLNGTIALAIADRRARRRDWLVDRLGGVDRRIGSRGEEAVCPAARGQTSR